MLHKLFVIFGIVLLVVFGIRELSGRGFYAYAHCVKEYRSDRCLGIKVDEPTVLMNDLYYLIREHIRLNVVSELQEKELKLPQTKLSELMLEEIPELTKASELIDNLLEKNIPITRSEFMKFWTLEVESFVVLDRKVDPRSNGIVDIKINHCYMRKEKWHTYEGNQWKTPWLCSVDDFELVRSRHGSSNNPYGWYISSLKFNECSDTWAKQCKNFYSHETQYNEK